MKVIGYIRVSTDEQAKDGISLDNQRERIEHYCKYRGFELIGIIEDAGVSGGKNKARAGFIELLEKIEQGEIKAVILYSLERLSRDMLTLLALERLLDENDIELHTIEGQIDTSTPDGWLNFAMKSFLGEMERRQIKYRTKKAMEYKKEQGNVVGSIPYGYKRVGNELIPDPQEQNVINLINDLYRQNKKLVYICNALNDRGIRTRTNKPFTPEQVKRLIKGYENAFTKRNTNLSINIRQFVTAIA